MANIVFSTISLSGLKYTEQYLNNLINQLNLKYAESNIIDYTDDQTWKDLYNNRGKTSRIDYIKDKILTYERVAELVKIRNFLWSNLIVIDSNGKYQDTITKLFNTYFNGLYNRLTNNGASNTLIDQIEEQTERIRTNGANDSGVIFFVDRYDEENEELVFKYYNENYEEIEVRVPIEDEGFKELFNYLIERVKKKEFLMSSLDYESIGESESNSVIHTHVVAYV